MKQAVHDLGRLTTLAIPAVAERLTVINSDNDLARALAEAGSAVILGGGSNVLLTESRYDRVLLLRQRGITIRPIARGHAVVSVAAGENWHDFVMHTLREGYCGLENLALIYGNCGAAPIQNIGAYGIEVSSFIRHVRAMHRDSGKVAVFSAADCRFGYRDSFFKSEKGRRWIVCEVEFELASYDSQQNQLNLDYPELAAAWACHHRKSTENEALQLAHIVSELRRRKLPDPAITPNAGSFFKNPIIEAVQHAALKRQLPGMVSYLLGDGRYKLAAGWLLDQAGLKGQLDNGVGMHETQALVLTNPGRLDGRSVVQFARRVQAEIAIRFGVRLEVEPDLI